MPDVGSRLMIVMFVIPVGLVSSVCFPSDEPLCFSGEPVSRGTEGSSGTCSLGVQGAGLRSGTDQRRDPSAPCVGRKLDCAVGGVFSFEGCCEGSGLAPRGLLEAEPLVGEPKRI